MHCIRKPGVRPLSPLYVILDAEVADRAGWSLADLASACLSGGARLFQIRIKRRSSARFLETARSICELAHRDHAIVIVNDRADVARMSGADGVHVGQDDLPVTAARILVGDTAVVGLSTHTREQLAAAVLQPVTYVACGPVFETRTKATGYERVGLEMVRQTAAISNARALPLVGIGGITLDTAADVMAAGAASVAVLSDLLSKGGPEARVREYMRRLAT